MVQTLLVVCDPANNNYESKNPSFARIRRVWRTTEQFWQNIQDQTIPAVYRLRPQYRLAIAVINSDELADNLGYYHAYDADINNRRLSVVWDSQDRLLLTADNLMAWARTEADSENTESGDESREMRLARSLLATLPDEIPLFEPGGYGQQRRELPAARIDRQRSNVFSVAYAPAITLLAEPSAFMALAPPAVALDVATKISQRYELEMSKVRNRLPLFLGVVFFDRRQPLFSALDASRRLLKQAFMPEECVVESSLPCLWQSSNHPPKHLQHSHFKAWQELKLKTANGEALAWYASTKMGDGSTPDEWYPYVYVQQDKDGNTPTGRKQFGYPDHPRRQWVNVEDVQNDDIVQFTPSRFSWLHLDTSARRFKAGQETHPLEELGHITTLWKKLQNLAAANKLSESQLHAIVTLLITKGKSWGTSSDEYQQLAEAILNKEGLDTLTVADLTSGRIQGVFELYHRILKQKLLRR